MTNYNENKINLSTYYADKRTAVAYQIWEDYGMETSDMVIDFINDFDYEKEISYLDEAFQEYADENTAIYDKDVFHWFSSANACVNYVNNLLKYEMSTNSDVSILEIIRTAQNLEIYNALSDSFDELKHCLTARYLMELGYAEIEEEILNTMAMNLRQHDYTSFETMFDTALHASGYDTYTCGEKAV